MKSRLTKNLGLKIMAVLFAVCLWLVVVQVSDPVKSQVYRNVAVTVQHEELLTNKGKTYQVLNNTNVVSVTVEAKRSVLSQIKQSDIVAYANMQEIELATLIPVTVSIRGYEGKYENAYAVPKNMEVYIDDEATNNFPIIAATTGTLRDGNVLGETKANPEKVQIKGPGSLVNRINRVVAKVDVSGLSTDQTLPGELVIYDSDDNIIDQTLLSNNIGDAGVSVDVKLLKTKSVGMTFQVAGQPADGYVYAGVKSEPMTLLVAGPTESLDALEMIEVPGSVLDATGLTGKKEVVVDVSKYLPSDIFLVDTNANSVVVTIFIERIGTRAFDLAVGSIKQKNVPEGMKSTYGNIEAITVEFEGSQEALNTLTEDKIEASIDLKSYKDAGTYDVPILIEAPGCTAVGTLTVQVILEKQ